SRHWSGIQCEMLVPVLADGIPECAVVVHLFLAVLGSLAPLTRQNTQRQPTVARRTTTHDDGLITRHLKLNRSHELKCHSQCQGRPNDQLADQNSCYNESLPQNRGLD